MVVTNGAGGVEHEPGACRERMRHLNLEAKKEKEKKTYDESGIRTHAPKDQIMLGSIVLHRNCADLSLAP